MRRVHFLVSPQTHLLDLAGPAQVFWEASCLGGAYEIHYCAVAETMRSAQGLHIAGLEPLHEVGSGEIVLAVGLDSTALRDLSHVPRDWLRAAAASGATVGSICSGAFVLAHAGLLDGRRCTTHWKLTDQLAQGYPAARVVRNRLFVEDGPILTSAGVASGIDMALAIVERDHGPIVAARVAREIVVYLRRSGENAQTSVFLDFRTHLNPGIHRAQDWLASHFEERPTIGRIASQAGMSPRNLTRLFRQATGITIKDYLTRLRLEVASSLLRSPDYTLERVALECGFRDARQLRRLWSKRFGINPSSWRARDDVGRIPS